MKGLKLSSARWMLVAVGICLLLLGVAAVLFFTIIGSGRQDIASSGDVNRVLNGSVVGLQVRSVRALYGVGDAVQVEGTVVVSAGAGRLVEVEVVDPEGQLWASERVKLSNRAEGTSAFSASFRSVRQDDSAGVYLIRAGLGGVQSNASFLVSASSSGLTAEVRSLRFQDAAGGGGGGGEEVVRSRRVGDMLLVAGSVANLAGVPSDLSFIVELRNASGSLVESGYVGTVVPAGGEKLLTVGWPAKTEGAYSIYAYVQDNVQSRRIISNIATLTINVQN